VDPKGSHLIYIQCIIRGQGERQGAYKTIHIGLL
jgi:hypothetical protein